MGAGDAFLRIQNLFIFAAETVPGPAFTLSSRLLGTVGQTAFQGHLLRMHRVLGLHGIISDKMLKKLKYVFLSLSFCIQ